MTFHDKRRDAHPKAGIHERCSHDQRGRSPRMLSTKRPTVMLRVEKVSDSECYANCSIKGGTLVLLTASRARPFIYGNYSYSGASLVYSKENIVTLATV
eukprot:502880-Pleurochrysis_carterae.AAC.1